jgi:hypothetical protein
VRARAVRRPSAGTTTVLAATVLVDPASQAASSALDPGFGSAGLAVVDSGGDEAIYSTIALPDGKILGIGYTAAGTRKDRLVGGPARDVTKP